MKTGLWLFLGGVVLIAVHLSEAWLSPQCYTGPITPGCTSDPTKVTATLPICPPPFSTWLAQARGAPGNSPRPNGVVPPWFNKDLALRGQQVTSEYRFPWYLVMFFGLLIEINMPDIRNPLMFNKKNTNGPDNAKRDLATLMQGLIWTKNFFWQMPMNGSSYVASIEGVRARHIDVQTRGNAQIAEEDCIVFPSDWEGQTVDDALWNAFASDINASPIPMSMRDPSPTQWLKCPPITDCETCYGMNVNGTDGTCESCSPIYNFPNCTGTNDGCTILSTECYDTITLENCTVSETNNLTCTVNCTNTWDLPYCSDANIGCEIVAYDCVNCPSCDATTCGNIDLPSCQYAQPPLYDCGSCTCDLNMTNCANCTTCQNYDTCLNYTIPLYNQQGMNLVIFNLVAYPVLFPSQLGINTNCDQDLWAFNHLWASIGYGLGIDDQWNIMLQPNITAARAYYRQIFDYIITPGLFNFDQQTKLMMDNVFKGLGTLTGGALTPKFLLHRFVKYFLGYPAPAIEAIMDPKDITLNALLDGAFLPAFVQNPIYRAFVNTAINDYTYVAANLFMPGKCYSYTKMASDCYV